MNNRYLDHGMIWLFRCVCYILSTSTFINDATRAWNRALIDIKNFGMFYGAKKAIRKYTYTHIYKTVQVV